MEQKRSQNNVPQSDFKYCPYCGNSIEISAKFCSNCGVALEKKDERDFMTPIQENFKPTESGEIEIISKDKRYRIVKPENDMNYRILDPRYKILDSRYKIRNKE
ncbi:MAG: zinc ribbon domain-containing protein [Promethearchaeota archaeon]